MIVTASAPGKVTLFGEHAVVYGKPAIAASIDKRVKVAARRRQDSSIRIAAHDLMLPGIILTLKESEVRAEADYNKATDAASYITKSLEVTSEYVGKRAGVDIEVRSEMPVGAGLGTSAAVSVATITAYSHLLGANLTVEEVARLGHRVELIIQGAASPMDTAVASRGGFIYIEPRASGASITDIPARELPVVIGYVEREARTGALVADVKRLRDRHPKAVDRIMEAIGFVVEEARDAIASNDLPRLGSLMNINHGLLEALGVSNRRLSELVYAARASGALGAKLTGAGGGGCMIALAPGRVSEVSAAIKASGGRVVEARMGGLGVTIEQS